MPQKSLACVIVEVMTGCRLIVMTGAAHQTLIILHIQVRLGAALRVGADPVLELDTGHLCDYSHMFPHRRRGQRGTAATSQEVAYYIAR